MKVFTVSRQESGRSILKFVGALLKDVPKSRVEKMFRNKDVSINSKRTNNKKLIVQAGDTVAVYGVSSNAKFLTYQKTSFDLKVIYEDQNILVVSKRLGSVTTGSTLALDNEVWTYLNYQQTDSFIPACIGRLDKVTSGLVIYGKNYLALKELKAKQRHFTKIYGFKSDLPASVSTAFRISHNEATRKQQYDPKGHLTKTIFNVSRTEKTAQLLTGKKHQIRLSLALLGFPIYGDKKYGGQAARRVYLHCQEVRFKALGGDLKYLNNLALVDKPGW